MTVPLEWLAPTVSYEVNRPVQYVIDDASPFMITGDVTECCLKNVPFSELELHVLRTLGDEALMKLLPQGCYGTYRAACDWARGGRAFLQWDTLYITPQLAHEFGVAIRDQRRAP